MEKIVPLERTHDRLGHGGHGGAAGLVVNHAHFAKDVSRPKVREMDRLPVEVLADFNLPVFDAVGRVATVVFVDNHCSSRISDPRNHQASSLCTLIARVLPDYTPAPRQRESGSRSARGVSLAGGLQSS